MDASRVYEPVFVLRYALWRLAELARDDSLSKDESVARAKIDVLPPDSEVPFADAEVVLGDHEGEVFERVFFEEENRTGYSSAAALQRFHARALRAWRRNGSARIRLVSPVRLLPRPSGQGVFDLADPRDRQQASEELSLEELGAKRRGLGLGRHTPDQLMAETLFVLSLRRENGDARDLYHDLYESLLHEIEEELERSIPGVELDLYGEKKGRSWKQLPGVESVAWWRETLLAETTVDQAEVPLEETDISSALRRGLFFDESQVTLSDIYVRQPAVLNWPVPDRKKSIPRTERGFGLLFRWWAEERSSCSGRPLLLLGSFGSGKSSLLTVFGEELRRRRTKIVPLLVPLRDLRGASTSRSLLEVLTDHVRRRWSIDLEEPTPEPR